MKGIPAPIRDFMLGLILEDRAPTYMLVSDEGRPVEWGGEWASYGVEDLRADADAGEQVPLLAGLLPLGGPSIFLPNVSTDGGAYADAYIFRGERGTWVLLLDSTDRAEMRQAMQQTSNVLKLRVSELEREEERLYGEKGELEDRLRQRNDEMARANQRLLQELSERKRAEAALRESEGRFRRLFDSNMIGIMFWDLRGSVTEANDAFLQMLGYTRDDLRAGGIRWNEITRPEGRAADEGAFAEMLDSGACTPYVKQFVRRDGSRADLFFGAALLPGSRDKIVCFALDPARYK